jgi:hypothetical protein
MLFVPALAGLRQISNPGISRGFLGPEEVAAASREIPVRVRSFPTSCKQTQDPKGRLVGFARGFGTHVEIKSREGPVAGLLISYLACRLPGNRVGA